MRPMKTKKFVKISAKNAKEIFEGNERAVFICASKMNPDDRGYVEEMSTNAISFEDIVCRYSEEKCSYKTGKYPAFFVAKKKPCN